MSAVVVLLRISRIALVFFITVINVGFLALFGLSAFNENFLEACTDYFTSGAKQAASLQYFFSSVPNECKTVVQLYKSPYCIKKIFLTDETEPHEYYNDLPPLMNLLHLLTEKMCRKIAPYAVQLSVIITIASIFCILAVTLKIFKFFLNRPGTPNYDGTNYRTSVHEENISNPSSIHHVTYCCVLVSALFILAVIVFLSTNVDQDTSDSDQGLIWFYSLKAARRAFFKPVTAESSVELSFKSNSSFQVVYLLFKSFIVHSAAGLMLLFLYLTMLDVLCLMIYLPVKLLFLLWKSGQSVIRPMVEARMKNNKFKIF